MPFTSLPIPSAELSTVAADARAAIDARRNRITPAYHTWTRATNVAMLGDSLTGLESKDSVNGRKMQHSWHNWLNIFLNNRINWVLNPATDVRSFGVAGNTAEQILARVPDVLATSADTVLVMAGANNISVDLPAVLAPKVTAIWDAIRTGGKQVIAAEILPLLDSVKNANVNETNDILRVEAAKRGIPIITWSDETRVGAYANPELFTVALGDVGVHLGQFGSVVAGRRAAFVLDKWIQKTAFAIPASGSADWITRNPYMTGGTTVPTDWSANNFGGGAVPTTSKRAWTAGGELTNTWFNVALTSGPLTGGVNVQIYQTVASSGLVAGDWVRPVGRVIIHPRSNWQSINFHCTFSNDSTCYSYGLFDGGTGSAQVTPDAVHAGMMMGIIVGPKVQVTAAAVASGFIYCTLGMLGYGSVSVSRMGVVKTTAWP